MATTEMSTGEGGTTERDSTGKSSGNRTVPATLLSLPEKLLEDVCAQADTDSLLALAMTCKALNPFAEARLWRDVDLRARYELDKDDSDSENDDSASCHAEIGLHERLTGIMTAIQSRPERTSYIRSLQFMLLATALQDLCSLCVQVSESVQFLRIDTIFPGWHATRYYLMLLSLPKRPLFTSLRYLQLECSLDVLSQLLLLMPNIEVVLADERRESHRREELNWPVMRNLRRINMPDSDLEDVYQLVGKRPALEDLELCDFDPPAFAGSTTSKPSQWLLDNVLPLPHLTRLAASDQSTTELALLSAIHLPTLQILEPCYRPKCWAECRLEFISIPPGFLHLREVRLRVDRVRREALSRLALKDLSTGSPQIHVVGRISQKLVGLADAAPSLQSVQFNMCDETVRRGVWPVWDDEWYGSRISTLVHGAQTVYIILSKTTSRPIPYRPGLEDDCNCACWPADSPLGETTTSTWYESANAIEEIQTDFQGEIVPKEILDAMARIDGVERWEGRGVQVGDAAWEVLLDWYAQLVAGRA